MSKTTAPDGFDPMLFVADNRILPQHVAFQDAQNDTIWIHPDDLRPAREPFVRAKLEQLCSIESPSYTADPTRAAYVNAISKTVKIADEDVGRQFSVQRQGVLPSTPYDNPYDFPLTHIKYNEPPPKMPTNEEVAQLREATKIYLMLEIKLTDKGYPNIINEAVYSLHSRGVTQPNTEQLFNELHNALDLTTTEISKTIALEGSDGVARLFEIAPSLKQEIDDLVEFTTYRGFPLNDVTNWLYGRAAPGMEHASVPDKIAVGVQEQVDNLIAHYRRELSVLGQVPEERENERLVAAALDNVPPVLAETFFEEGGVIVFTPNPSLYGLLGQPATGYHINHVSPSNPDNQVHQVFISQELGLPANTKTLVHEIHHLLYPENIGVDEAYHADVNLQRDENRLLELKELVDLYSTGNAATRDKVLQVLDSEAFSDARHSFGEALDGSSMQTFIGAVNQAYHYLQMESPTYQRIPTYARPLDRFQEVIPRYAEMRFVDRVDHPAMMEFIVPGITDMYENLYIPHIEDRLEHLKATQPIKADAVRAAALQEEYNYAAPSPLFQVNEQTAATIPQEAYAKPLEQSFSRLSRASELNAVSEPISVPPFEPLEREIPSTAISGYTVEPQGPVNHSQVQLSAGM